MTHKTRHDANLLQCHQQQDLLQCQPATMLTCPTNNKTHPNATLLYVQDLPRHHHDEGYHDHVSEDDDSNDDGMGDDGGRDGSSRCGNGSGLTCIYFNL